MKTHNYILLFTISALLSACAGSAPASIASVEPTSELAAAYPPSSCTAVSSEEDRSSIVANLPFAPVTDADWQRGPADARITIVEYSDFQCPSCAQLASVLKELQDRYPNDLRIVYRHFPLSGTADQPLHQNAALAMQAAEAAGSQGQFWEMHDQLFSRQAEWTAMNQDDFKVWLDGTAQGLGLDLNQFDQDAFSEAAAAKSQAAWQDGLTLKLPGTPYVLINGIPYYSGPLDINSMDNIVQVELLSERQFHACPEMTLNKGANYTATLHTEKGDIVVQLYPDVAPMAVNSFIFLAEHGWYDNVTFHRVLPGFVAQAGDPTGSGYGGPGYAFAIEVNTNVVFDRAGLFAMANSGPTSNGSQFFITLNPEPQLNGQYTIFGEVIQGMDVVENLTARDPSQSSDLPPGDRILNVTIEEN